LLGVRNGCSSVVSLHLTIAFIVSKIEELIFQNGSADGSAKLVADKDRLLRLTCKGAGRRSEGANSVQNRIAVILPHLTVKLIRSAIDGHVDHSTRSATILSAIVACFHAKL